MTNERQRAIEPPRRPGRFAAFAAALVAGLLLGGAPAVAEPVFDSSRAFTSIQVDDPTASPFAAGYFFKNAGTNPRFTEAVFSTMAYYQSWGTGIRNGLLVVRTKSAEDLTALPSPPSSPFAVTVRLTMTNDEGETATGTVTFKTTYELFVPGQPPVFESSEFGPSNPANAPVGTLVSVFVDEVFDRAGTNPRFTDAEFSTTDYYDRGYIGTHGERIYVKVKRAGDLRALPTPPPNPFTVDVTATMTNDEGQTATGTIVFRTYWDNR